MSLLTHPRGNNRFGFTLVELLVALVILLLILAVCSALTFTAQNLLNNGMERIDADSQARLFFDRITLDLAAMVKRNDVDAIVKNSSASQGGNASQPGNDSLAFYAKTSGYYASSPDPAPRTTLALLAYRVNSQTYQLERLAKGIGWNGNSSGTPMVFLPVTPPGPGLQLSSTWPLIAGLGNGSVPNLNLGTDPDYQVLADGIFRFEYCYVLRDGTTSNSPYVTPADTALDGWRDVVALYVAIAVLDDRNRVAVSGGGSANANLATATAAFKDFTVGANQVYPPLAQWESVLDQPTFAAQAGLPAKAASAVRIFARTISINNVTPDPSL